MADGAAGVSQPLDLWPEPDWLAPTPPSRLRLGPHPVGVGPRPSRAPGSTPQGRPAVVQKWPEWFRLTEDRFAGKPFRLNTWQAITVRLMVGWKVPTEILDEDRARAAPSSSASTGAALWVRARTASRSSWPPWPAVLGL
jgi:hypothetical protein